MEELLIHISKIVYRFNIPQEDKDKLVELVNEMKKKSPKFIPPTVKEVSIYLKQQGYSYPEKYADQFVSFYESKGWMIGKNKMKSWKAATKQFREWEKKARIYN